MRSYQYVGEQVETVLKESQCTGANRSGQNTPKGNREYHSEAWSGHLIILKYPPTNSCISLSYRDLCLIKDNYILLSRQGGGRLRPKFSPSNLFFTQWPVLKIVLRRS